MLLIFLSYGFLICTLFSYCPTRTKNCLPNIDLFGKTVQVVTVNFTSDDHKMIHDSLYKVTLAAFDALIKASAKDPTVMNSQTSRAWLSLSVRLRRCCNSGTFVPRELHERAKEALAQVKTRNGRIKRLSVQEARDVLTKLDLTTTTTDDVDGSTYPSDPIPLPTPPKIQTLLHLIKSMKPDEKGLVFSQWPTFLDIIQKELVQAGYQVVRLDGSMSMDERAQAMTSYENNDDVRFMLCSLFAAGEGINLTRGNVVFMCDVWWNEAKEIQAIDRCHRVGQVRPVRVYHFIMKDTIEERMVQMQKAKALLGKGTMTRLNKDEEKLAKIPDIKDLLQLKPAFADNEWE